MQVEAIQSVTVGSKTVNLTSAQIEQFWNQVEKSSDCWNWKGKLNNCHYGTFYINKQFLLTHRLAFALTNRDVKIGECVCHHCDNPGCVNPDHLWIGTIADNAKDREEKGRGVRSKEPKKFISRALAEKIRHAHSQTALKPSTLGLIYGVSRRCVRRIIRGETWPVLPGSC